MPKFTRVALEGATIDGREISRQQIQEMAETYDPDKKHGARIWLEHYRSLWPDGMFPALGDVVELKAQDVEVDGKKRLGLYARLNPTDKLIKMNQDRQKIFTSIEIDKDYASSGKAYLSGLAVTDTPASQGTQMLKFSQQQNFKELEGKLFSEYLEAELLLDEETDDDDGKGVLDQIFTRIETLFKKNPPPDNTNNSNPDDSQLLAFAQTTEMLAKELQQSQQECSTLKQAHEGLLEKFNTLHADYTAFKQDVEQHSTNRKKTKPSGTGAPKRYGF